MLKKFFIVVLCAAGYLWFVGNALAEAYKMYRYTDAGGTRHFVNSKEDVPAEFLLSASAVMVLKDYKPDEAENAETPKEATPNGAAVKVLSLNVAAAENGKCGFSGEVKNEMKVKVEKVNLRIEVKTKDGTTSLDIPVGEGGAMGAGETVKVARVADVPAADLAGYSYNVTWQASRVEVSPAKTPQGQPSPAAVTKENPSPQPPPAAPVKRYRTRNHPAAPPAAGEK